MSCVNNRKRFAHFTRNYNRDNPGMGHCQFMRKLCKIEEIRLQIWKGPLYNLSKYTVSFGLGPQIRVHRPLHFP